MPSPATRAWRAVQQLLGLGTTSTPGDDSGAVQTVQVRLDSLRTFDATPVVQQFGFGSCLPIGSQVVRLTGMGDSTKGIAVATVHGPSRVRGLSPGQTVLYDLIGSRLMFPNDGTILLLPQGGTVRVQGNLQVTGEVIAHADSGPVHLTTHVHGGVQQGGSNTAKPSPGS